MRTSNRHQRGGSSGMHPERSGKLDSVRVDTLYSHPLSVKLYGEPKPPADLLKSIEEIGLMQPLIVNDYSHDEISQPEAGVRAATLVIQGEPDRDIGARNEILAGHTRAAAWRTLWEQKKGSVWIPCRFVHLAPLEAEKFVIESNYQRVKTKEQKAREFTELKRIEAALAKERMLKGTKLNPRLNLIQGKAAAIAAKAVGLGSENTAKKIEAVVIAADQGSTEARAVLDAVNAGTMSASRAHEVVYIRRVPKPPEVIAANKRVAAELAKETGWEISPSRTEGLFHVMIRDLTPERITTLFRVKETL